MMRVEKTVFHIMTDDDEPAEVPGVWVYDEANPDERLPLTETAWHALREGVKNGDFDDV